MDALPSENDDERVLPRHGHLRGLAPPVLFGAAVLFISATLLLGGNISEMREDLVWIEHTQKILLQVASAQTGLAGDALTVRSYALTGQSQFLRYQTIERDRLTRAMTKLAVLTAVSPRDTRRFRKIEALVHKHMNLYGRLRGIGPDHAKVVAAAITNRANRAVMLDTRRALAAFYADKVRLLGERQQRLTKQISQAYVQAIGIIVAAFVLGGAGIMISGIGASPKK